MWQYAENSLILKKQTNKKKSSFLAVMLLRNIATFQSRGGEKWVKESNVIETLLADAKSEQRFRNGCWAEGCQLKKVVPGICFIS